MLSFTAIDFETANSHRGSPCQVGLVRVVDGRVVEEESWLIKPPEAVGHFNRFNVNLHGIDAHMVRDAPPWRSGIADIAAFVQSDVLVAHNASFDIGVIRDACAFDRIEPPDLSFACTMVLARKILKLPSYRLPYVLEELGRDQGVHHDALDDARAAADVALGLASKYRSLSLTGLLSAADVSLGSLIGGRYKGSVSMSAREGTRLVAAEANPDADPEGQLFGQVVVFTGALQTMTRQEAWDAVARSGGSPEKTTTRRTNVLVVGNMDPRQLVPGAVLTRKAKRALELQEAGQAIEIMTEADFLQHVAPPPETKPSAATQPSPVDAGRSKVPRPLRRRPTPTSQTCFAPGCTSRAAFRTHKENPTWCTDHIDFMTLQSGLVPLEEFSHPLSYRMTSCASCGCEAHYRFTYIREKLSQNEPVCRACFWRAWAAQGDRAGFSSRPRVDITVAQTVCAENGFKLLEPLTDPQLANDPYRTECLSCGLISAQRLGDVAFGCPCVSRSK